METNNISPLPRKPGFYWVKIKSYFKWYAMEWVIKPDDAYFVYDLQTMYKRGDLAGDLKYHGQRFFRDADLFLINEVQILTPDEQLESNKALQNQAQEFAEWIQENMYSRYWGSDLPNKDKWYDRARYKSPLDRVYFTTAELFEEYLKQRK